MHRHATDNRAQWNGVALHTAGKKQINLLFFRSARSITLIQCTHSVSLHNIHGRRWRRQSRPERIHTIAHPLARTGGDIFMRHRTWRKAVPLNVCSVFEHDEFVFEVKLSTTVEWRGAVTLNPAHVWQDTKTARCIFHRPLTVIIDIYYSFRSERVCVRSSQVRKCQSTCSTYGAQSEMSTHPSRLVSRRQALAIRNIYIDMHEVKTHTLLKRLLNYH